MCKTSAANAADCEVEPSRRKHAHAVLSKAVLDKEVRATRCACCHTQGHHVQMHVVAAGAQTPTRPGMRQWRAGCKKVRQSTCRWQRSSRACCLPSSRTHTAHPCVQRRRTASCAACWTCGHSAASTPLRSLKASKRSCSLWCATQRAHDHTCRAHCAAGPAHACQSYICTKE